VAEFCYFVLANSVLASVLALLVWSIGTWIKRPAVLHLLWVLVLLRLIVPPLLHVDISRAREWISNSVRRGTEEQQAVIREQVVDHSQIFSAINKALHSPNFIPRRSVIPESDNLAVTGMSARTTLVDSCWFVAERTSSLMARFCDATIFVFFLVWCAGTSIILLIQIRAATLFHRTVKQDAYHSRIWQKRTDNVAKRMGIRSCPQLLLVRATISPMLWGFGHRARILFPEKLLEDLDTDRKSTRLNSSH
jgi:beta-lactamase regulating signal transducer with metallopeptidase domain